MISRDFKLEESDDNNVPRAQNPKVPKTITTNRAVSYTHLTLPTNREV